MQEETGFRAPGMQQGAQPGSTPTGSIVARGPLSASRLCRLCQKPCIGGHAGWCRTACSETRLSVEALTKSVRPAQMTPVHHSARQAPDVARPLMGGVTPTWLPPPRSPHFLERSRPPPALTQPDRASGSPSEVGEQLSGRSPPPGCSLRASGKPLLGFLAGSEPPRRIPAVPSHMLGSRLPTAILFIKSAPRALGGTGLGQTGPHGVLSKCHMWRQKQG